MRGVFISTPKNRYYKCLCSVICCLLTASLVLMPSAAQAQTVLNLPVPGTMVAPSPAFVPVLLKGMTVHPEDPFQFDFIIDSGNTQFTPDQVKAESEKLVKYFLASMTVPKDDLWVNLSPYEEDRIIPDELGKTELGRDMLAQDYILKQLTASLMYPEEELGKKFWDKIYQRAKEEFGTSEIPVNTFNKVWILPDAATVYEHEQTVYIVDAHLKVMLDSDYVAMAFQQNAIATSRASARDRAMDFQQKSTDKPNVGARRAVPLQDNSLELSEQIIREIILPEIEREVNEGAHFAPLRQIYHSLILAKWYKETVKNSLLNQIYADKNKIGGISLEDGSDGESIADQVYEQYMEAYKKGVFNYIKEDYDRLSNEIIPRKYFSGGFKLGAGEIKHTSSPLSIHDLDGKGYQASVTVGMQKNGSSSPIDLWSIEKYNRQLNHYDPLRRLAAMERIKERGKVQLRDEVISKLADTDQKVSAMAREVAEALGANREQIEDGYIKVLSSYSDLILPSHGLDGTVAIRNLINLKSMKAVTRLKELMRTHYRAETRKLAVEAIIEIGDEDAPLIQKLVEKLGIEVGGLRNKKHSDDYYVYTLLPKVIDLFHEGYDFKIKYKSEIARSIEHEQDGYWEYGQHPFGVGSGYSGPDTWIEEKSSWTQKIVDRPEIFEIVQGKELDQSESQATDDENATSSAESDEASSLVELKEGERTATTITSEDFAELVQLRQEGAVGFHKNVDSRPVVPALKTDVLTWNDIDDRELQRLKEQEAEMYRDGKIAPIVMVGGEATRFGGPKTFVEVSDDLGDFLEIKAANLRWLQETFGEKVPLYLLSSEKRLLEFKQALEEREYYGMTPEDFQWYVQGTVDTFIPTDEEIEANFKGNDIEKYKAFAAAIRAKNPDGIYRFQGEERKVPPGHFDAISSFIISGRFSEALAQGVEIMPIFNIDNLQAVLKNDGVIAHFAENNLDFAFLLAEKNLTFTITRKGATEPVTLFVRFLENVISFDGMEEFEGQAKKEGVRYVINQKDKTIDVFDIETNQRIITDQKIKPETGGTLVQPVDEQGRPFGVPVMKEGFELPSGFDHANAPYFNTNTIIVRLQSLLKLLGVTAEILNRMGFEERSALVREQLVKQIKANFEFKKHIVEGEFPELGPVKDGKTEIPVSQVTRIMLQVAHIEGANVAYYNFPRREIFAPVKEPEDKSIAAANNRESLKRVTKYVGSSPIEVNQENILEEISQITGEYADVLGRKKELFYTWSEEIINVLFKHYSHVMGQNPGALLHGVQHLRNSLSLIRSLQIEAGQYGFYVKSLIYVSLLHDFARDAQQAINIAAKVPVSISEIGDLEETLNRVDDIIPYLTDLGGVGRNIAKKYTSKAGYIEGYILVEAHNLLAAKDSSSPVSIDGLLSVPVGLIGALQNGATSVYDGEVIAAFGDISFFDQLIQNMNDHPGITIGFGIMTAGFFYWFMRNHGINNILYIAASLGNLDMAQRALKRGAKPNARVFGSGGLTPLMIASSYNQADMVSLLIQAGADLNSELNGMTALDIAKEKESFEALKILAQAGAKSGSEQPRPTVQQKPKSELDILIGQLESSQNPEVRAFAALRIGARREEAKEAIPALIISLKNDPEDIVRINAAGALGDIRVESSKAASALMWAIQNDSNEDVILNSVISLEELGSASVPALSLLEDVYNNVNFNDEIRLHARKAYGIIKFENDVNSSKSSSPISLTEEVGGIDMNNIDVETTGARVTIEFDPIDVQEILNMDFDGLVPVIINLTPLPSVLPLLGLAPQREEDEDLQLSSLN